MVETLARPEVMRKAPSIVPSPLHHLSPDIADPVIAQRVSAAHDAELVMISTAYAFDKPTEFEPNRDPVILKGVLRHCKGFEQNEADLADRGKYNVLKDSCDYMVDGAREYLGGLFVRSRLEVGQKILDATGGAWKASEEGVRALATLIREEDKTAREMAIDELSNDLVSRTVWDRLPLAHRRTDPKLTSSMA